MDVEAYRKLLLLTGYDKVKSQFLVNGFKNGFDLGYRGPDDVTIKSPNLRLEVGDEVDLWNKVMKEVGEKRYAGPYREHQLPFTNFVQSPIGLVPKDNGRSMRLIFHLSYPKTKFSTSINANTPKEFCKVNYPDFGEAVRLCLQAGKFSFAGKSDMKSAFRNLGISRKFWKFLVLKARSPFDGEWYYFYDKALPFGSSVSCFLFQEFSNSIAHVVKFICKRELINYLDDYFL